MAQIEWHDAGTEEPGDQNASTDVVPHGYWSLGPSESGWAVELIALDEGGEEDPSASISLGDFPSESSA